MTKRGYGDAAVGEALGALDPLGDGVGDGVGVLPGGTCAPYIASSQICVWRTVTFGTEKVNCTVELVFAGAVHLP